MEPEVIASKTRTRITVRLMPFLVALFIIAYIDRANVGYAQLEMVRDMSFDPEMFGFGAGIFFLGYFLLEIPSTLLVENWSARKWLARIIISWGLLAVLMGFIQNATHFYVVRFLLGLAEAGFFPGVLVYLSHWYRQADRAKVVAMFMSALPLANIFGAGISAYLIGATWFGLAGWRWLFLLEGIPAVIMGIATIFYLTDRPEEAKWLEPEERDWIAAELTREREAKKSVRAYGTWEALKDRNVVLLAIGYFFAVTSAYGFTFWLPGIVKELSEYSSSSASLLAALPYCVGLIAILFVGWSSDRTGERRWHTAVSLFLVCGGLLGSVVTHDYLVVSMVMLCIAGAGLHGYLPGFWALPGAFLTESAAAASTGLINSVGNLGGFAGGYLVGFLVKQTGTKSAGVIYLGCSALTAAIIILFVRATGGRSAAK